MRAVALLLAIPIVLWCGQSVLLWHAGRPLRRRIGLSDLPRRHRRLNRILTNCVLIGALLVYPLLRQSSPLDYYLRFFPAGERPLELIWGAAAAVLYLVLLFLAWLVSGNVCVRAGHEPWRLLRRLAGVPLTAVLAPLVEELLFRAVLLADLRASLDTPAAVAIAAFIFAVAHYIRRVKRYWTFPGHLALGVVLCLAFVWTEALWLPLGLHAGGVLVLMGARPLVRYTGPAWLVGASIFPYAGVVGLSGLGLLALNLWRCYGGAA